MCLWRWEDRIVHLRCFVVGLNRVVGMRRIIVGGLVGVIWIRLLYTNCRMVRL